MQVYCLTSLDELAPYGEDWDRLAADKTPCDWNRLSTWWREHAGDPTTDENGPQLAVLCVFDHREDLVGIAPWFVDRLAAHGRVLRSLGTHEVGKADPGILCRPGCQLPVAQALADYLTEPGDANDPDHLRWDLLELTGVATHDATVSWLVRYLANRGASVHSRPADDTKKTFSFEVVPDRTAARWRHQLCLAGSQVKHWFQGDSHRNSGQAD